ncbi:HD-GYP domain-containing protein [Treponema primitia]|uniref:HD-GYP domain-containing protein n=1 Tax=Treponema primitia TaxID=88058 RepID=UPI0002555889|nr:hypothetical protein [Treponema primitia]
MIHKEIQDHFIENAETYTRLTNEKLPRGLNADEIIKTMIERTGKCRIIMVENNTFIDENLKPVFADPAALAEAEADELFAFACRLYSVPYLGDEGKSVDQFLALELFKALAVNAQATGKIERELQCQYIIGEICHYLNGIMFTAEAIEAMHRVLDLAGDYVSIKDKKTRYYAVAAYRGLTACLFNYGSYREFFDTVDKAVLFYARQDVRSLDPDFPWDELTNKVYKLQGWVGSHLEFGVGKPIDEDLAERNYQVLVQGFDSRELGILHGSDREKRRAVIGEETKKTEKENGMTIACYAVSAFHTGHITMEQYLDILRDCLAVQFEWQDPPRDFVVTNNRINVVITCSALLARYLNRISSSHEELPGVALALFKFLRGISLVDLSVIEAMGDELQCVMDNALDIQNRREYIDLILKTTTHNHLPTYVHSMMVARMITLITKYFIDHDPAKLINMRGAKTAEEVVALEEEILEEANLAGMAHDVGKISYIQAVSVTSRRLTDNEFGMIKRHPGGGFKFLDKEIYGSIPDVVRGHHKDHNGKRGYPPDFDNTTSPYQFMIDICTIADCIDAATDTIGRSYQINRTADFIMNELIELAGDRYSTEAVEALKDPEIRSQITDALNNYRREAYYKAYQEML